MALARLVILHFSILNFEIPLVCPLFNAIKNFSRPFVFCCTQTFYKTCLNNFIVILHCLLRSSHVQCQKIKQIIKINGKYKFQIERCCYCPLFVFSIQFEQFLNFKQFPKLRSGGKVTRLQPIRYTNSKSNKLQPPLTYCHPEKSMMESRNTPCCSKLF